MRILFLSLFSLCKTLENYNSFCGVGCPGCDVSNVGGKVIYTPMNLYHIYIGQTSADYKKGVPFYDIATRFAEGLSLGSPYLDILSYYKNITGGSATNQFKYINSSFYAVPSTTLYMANITSAFIKGIVLDPNGIYAVFFRGDYNLIFNGVKWCQNFCGVHGKLTVLGKRITYFLVGDTNYGSCANGCATFYIGYVQNYYHNGVPPICYNMMFSGKKTCVEGSLYCACYYPSPNGNAGADAAMSVYSHELAETVTDGLGGEGYYVNRNFKNCTFLEMADLCYRSFSGMKKKLLPSGVEQYYNVAFKNGYNFILHDLWAFLPPYSQCRNSPLPKNLTTYPTIAPTSKPTRIPTLKPTRKPTSKPTRKPTSKPTWKPTLRSSSPI